MGSKSGRKTIFRKIDSRLCRYPADQKFCRNRSISLHFQNKRVFVLNGEIQDGRHKWQENDFCEKLLVDSADTLRVKNFVEIALSHSVSDINAFLHLTQKFKMAAGKHFLKKVPSRLCSYPVGQKFCRNRSISLPFRDKHVFAFNAEFQDGRQKWRENDFCEKLPVDSKFSSKLFHLAPFPR